MTHKIATYIFTGFLGSGKTTLLNKLLKDPALANTAVIINEFGETGLDHLLVEKSDDQIIELSNGCLCCTVRGQLVETLETILSKKPDRIIIETTGLADPVPVIQSLLKTPSLIDHINFGSMITVFDLVHGLKNLDNYEEANKQILFADIICLSKSDLVTNEVINTCKDKLKSLNPNAIIIDKNEFIKAPQFLEKSATQEIAVNEHTHHHHAHDITIHNKTLCCTTLKHDKPISKNTIDMFLDLLFSAHSQHILRIKGLVNIECSNSPLLIQGVGGSLGEPALLDKWPSQDTSTRITIFLEHMEADFVQRLFAGFVGTPLIDTPDKQALTDNPLSILGVEK